MGPGVGVAGEPGGRRGGAHSNLSEQTHDYVRQTIIHFNENIVFGTQIISPSNILIFGIKTQARSRLHSLVVETHLGATRPFRTGSTACGCGSTLPGGISWASATASGGTPSSGPYRRRRLLVIVR